MCTEPCLRCGAKKLLSHFSSLKRWEAITALAAVGTLLFSVQTLREAQKQFEIQNRPYIGIENLEVLNSSGTTAAELRTARQIVLANVGNTAGFFTLTGSDVICLGGQAGFLLPQQRINLSCEMPYGDYQIKKSCVGLLDDEMIIEYGSSKGDKKFKTVFGRSSQPLPITNPLRERAQQGEQSDCDFNFPWSAKEAT